MSYRKIYRQAVRNAQNLQKQIKRQRRYADRLALHPLVNETLDVLRDPNLEWDCDFEATRLPLADLLESIGHLAIITPELVALCEPLVLGDDDLRDGLL